MPTQYEILKYLQHQGGKESVRNLYNRFGVATGKKLKLLRNAKMVDIIEDASGVRNVILLENVTASQIESKKPSIV
jgi:hypothetical protein